MSYVFEILIPWPLWNFRPIGRIFFQYYALVSIRYSVFVKFTDFFLLTSITSLQLLAILFIVHAPHVITCLCYCVDIFLFRFNKAIVKIVSEHLGSDYTSIVESPETYFVDFLREPPEATGDEPEDFDFSAPKIYDPVPSFEFLEEKLLGWGFKIYIMKQSQFTSYS